MVMLYLMMEVRRINLWNGNRNGNIFNFLFNYVFSFYIFIILYLHNNKLSIIIIYSRNMYSRNNYILSYNLKKILETTQLSITEEKDIKPYYTSNPNNLSEIDYIIQDVNISLCIQSKLVSRDNRSNLGNLGNLGNLNNLDNFINFTQCIMNLEHYMNQSKIIGLYLTKNKIDETTRTYLDNENYKYNNGLSRIKYYNLFHNDEDKLLQKVQKFLHKIKFFMYDGNGDCVMGCL